MSTASAPRKEKLWIYSVLPAVILNLGGVIIFGASYALAALRNRPITEAVQDRLQFALYVFIFLVEWRLPHP